MKESLDFIDNLDTNLPFRKYIDEIECRLIIKSLKRFNCNVTQAARYLGFNHRTTLVERMKRFNLKKSILKGDLQNESKEESGPS